MPASEKRLREVLRLSAPQTLNDKLDAAYQAIREDEMNHKTVKYRGRVVLLAAAVMLLFTATALAVSIHSDFFHNAYGTAVSSQEPFTKEVFDPDKNRTYTEEHYGTQRVEADAETAERLLGRYVAPLDLTAEACGYTFTVREIALDENFIGAVTIDIADPAGHGIRKDQEYNGPKGEFNPFSLCFEAGNDLIDSSELIADEGFTDTFARVVSYLTPFRADQAVSTLSLTISVFPAKYAEPEEIVFEIPVPDRVPVKAFAGQDIAAELSPVGLRLTWPAAGSAPEALPEARETNEEFIPERILVHLAGGETYTAFDEENKTINIMCMSKDSSFRNTFYAFNRLVDPDEVTGISVQYFLGSELHEALLVP